MSRILKHLTDAILIVSGALFLYLIINGRFDFEAVIYPYIHQYLPLKSVITLLLVCPIVVFWVYLTERNISKHEILIIISWLVLGFIVQIYLRNLSPYSFSQIITSDTSNSFYSPTLIYSLKEFLSKAVADVSVLPPHVRTNMAGKVIFFYLLKALTVNPEIMGYLIVFFSNIGGIFVYFISKYIFNSKLTALYSLVLYLFFPAKIIFFPILNTVSPVFTLICFFLMLEYVIHHRDIFLLLLGIFSYILFIFEPTPLISGIIFLAILVKYIYEKQINSWQCLKLVVLPTLVFVAMHFYLELVFGYSALNQFIYTFTDAVNYTVRTNKNYSEWVVQNLKEFLVGGGLTQSILFIGGLIILIRKLLKHFIIESNKKVKFIMEPGPLMSFSLVILILTLDLSGVIQGEALRFWIFIMVFLQIIAAYICAFEKRRSTFYIILISNLFQTAVSIAMVSFVTP